MFFSREWFIPYTTRAKVSRYFDLFVFTVNFVLCVLRFRYELFIYLHRVFVSKWGLPRKLVEAQLRTCY